MDNSSRGVARTAPFGGRTGEKSPIVLYMRNGTLQKRLNGTCTVP
jgi:hypothetical protein